MGTEELARIPATEGSISQLHELVNMLSLYGRSIDFGLRARFRPLGNEIVLIHVFDFPTEARDILSSITDKVLIKFEEDLGDVFKTSMYRINPDKKTISKTESVAPNENPSYEEMLENIETFSEEVQELEVIGLDEFLEKHPDYERAIREYGEVIEQEEQLGLPFVSEAEIQEVIRRLQLIDPETQTIP